MKLVIYLSLHVLFLAKEIKKIHSPPPGTPNPGLERSPSRYLSFRTPPGPSSNPCDRAKVNVGASDMHEACNNECLAVKTSVNNFCDLYPNYKTIKLLQGKCGSVNEGKCAYFRKASDFPICFCHTSYGLNKSRRTPLFICRLGIPLLRKVTNVGIGLKRCVSRSDKKAGERLQTGKTRSGPAKGFWTNAIANQVNKYKIKLEHEEQDDEPEGFVLVTDWQISGTKIRAVLDTGSGETLISSKFAKDIVPLDVPWKLVGTGGNELKLYGKTTIDVQIKGGIIIAVTGIAAGIPDDIIIGNDFFVKHAVKIKIPERTMEITFGQTKVDISIKFRTSLLPRPILSLNSDPEGYSPLQISAQLNGHETKIMIDTGASSSVIRKDFVAPETIKPARMRGVAADGTNVVAKGRTDFKLLIEETMFTGWAFVPEYNPFNSLLSGNGWNKHWIKLIDFEQDIVTLKCPETDKDITTRAFV